LEAGGNFLGEQFEQQFWHFWSGNGGARGLARAVGIVQSGLTRRPTLPPECMLPWHAKGAGGLERIPRGQPAAVALPLLHRTRRLRGRCKAPRSCAPAVPLANASLEESVSG